MEFRILGPLEVLRDGRPVPLTRAKQRALLLALLLRANEVVSVDSLVDALWGERPPPTAHVALQGHVSQVRKVLPPQTLLTRPPGYVLQIEPEWVDAYRFGLLRAQAREALGAGDPHTAATALHEALALWRGSPLVDLADDSLLRGEAGRLEELRVAAVEERVEAELAAGRDGDLVPELESLVQASPFRERLRAQLMLALYRAGRQADALQAYADARQALVEELGIEPGPDLQRLQQQILRQDPVLRPCDAAPTTGLIFGRSSELRELRAAVHDMLAGRGRVLLLEGAAGIGKTRLAEEIEAYARAQGAATLWGRSYEGDAEPPYWPWVQVLRELPDAHVAGRAAGLVAGGVEEEETADAERDRFRIFEEVWSSIRARANEQPLVLVLEDLHWADPASLLVLLFAARNMRDANVLIVGTYREDDLDRTHPLTPIVGELRRERLCDRIHLDGLGPDDVGALVEALAGDSASSLAATLHADTGGNPFFVREIVEHLVETGRIGEGAAPDELDIPHSVREVVEQRLTRLSDACRELLTLASVLGEFSETVAARILGVDRAGMLARLDEANVAGVLVETGLGRYAFSHALVRETLAAQLDTMTRLELHRRAGETLEGMYGNDLEPHLGELAHHFFEAARGGDVRKAIDYCRRAAEHDTSQLAYEQAAQRLARALQLLAIEEGASPQERCELLLTLGDAYWRSSSFRKARRTFREAAELARAHGPADALARSAIGYAGGAFDITIRNDFLTELIADALEALPPEETKLRARLLARLAQALVAYPERAEERAQLAEAAMALAQDDSTRAYVITSALMAQWRPEDAGQRLEMSSAIVELGTRLRNDGLRLNGLFWRIQTHAELGNAVGIETDVREYERCSDRRPVVYARWSLHLLGVLQALLVGDVREGRRLAELALEMGESHDNPNALQVFAVQSIGLARLEGSADQLLELGGSVLEQYPNVWAWRAIFSTLYAWSGREEEARTELSRVAARGFALLPRDLLWTSGVVFSAETAALLDAKEEAEALYALLQPIGHLHVVLGWVLHDGSIARRLALLAATLGRFTEAEAHFLAAIESERRMGAAAAVVQSQCDYAFVLVRTGRPELLTRASELVASALPVAERLELPGPVERLTALQQLLDDASRT